MKMVSLASTLHNPNSEMLSITKKFFRKLKKIFMSLNLVVTKTTDRELIKYLKKQKVNLQLVKPIIPLGSSSHRKLAVKMALNNNESFQLYFHIDFDRLLHWISHYPEELKELLTNIPSFDLTSVGRTKRAFKTHPKVQRKMEDWTNEKLYKLIPIRLDMPSGCQILSIRMAKIIVDKASENMTLSEAEGDWLGLAYKNKLKIGLVKKDGMEFETADFHKSEIKRAGSLKKWVDENYETGDMWKLRRLTAEKTVIAAKRSLSLKN